RFSACFGLFCFNVSLQAAFFSSLLVAELAAFGQEHLDNLPGIFGSEAWSRNSWTSDRYTIGSLKFGSPTLTKDGVTVAKEIELKDPLDNMGAQMVREVASKTSDVAGDGTTTATVLAQAIYREGAKNVTAGANPMA